MKRVLLTVLLSAIVIGSTTKAQEYYRGAVAAVFPGTFKPDAICLDSANQDVCLKRIAAGVGQLVNGAGTGFTRLILGTNDATNNGIALKLNAGALEIRRGDDSNPANLTANTITALNQIQSGGGKFVADLNGKITGYANVATAGWGVTAIQAAANITAQTSNATITSYANGAADGDFEISGQINVTASTTLATTITCTYTDVTNSARTLVLPVTAENGTMVAAGAISGAGATRWSTTVQHIRAKASTTISLITSAGTFTGVTYSASGAIRQIS